MPALIDTNDYQGAQLLLLTSQTAVDPISPDVDPTLFVQSVMAPLMVLLAPELLDAARIHEFGTDDEGVTDFAGNRTDQKAQSTVTPIRRGSPSWV